MIIDLDKFREFTNDIQVYATQKIAYEAPYLKMMTAYEVPVYSNGTGYYEMKYGGVGSTGVVSLPLVSTQQHELTAINAKADAKKGGFAVLGHSIQWTVLEYQRALNFYGLDTLKVQKDALAQKAIFDLNSVALNGVKEYGMTGLMNNPAITISANKSGKQWSASTTTVDDIFGDVAELIYSIVNTSGGIVEPDTLIVGASNLALLTTKTYSGTNVSVLDRIKATFNGINVLGVADSFTLINGKNRIIAYKNTESNIRVANASVQQSGNETTKGQLVSLDFLYGTGSPEILVSDSIQYREGV